MEEEHLLPASHLSEMVLLWVPRTVCICGFRACCRPFSARVSLPAHTTPPRIQLTWVTHAREHRTHTVLEE